jgi:hypothetical protein
VAAVVAVATLARVSPVAAQPLRHLVMRLLRVLAWVLEGRLAKESQLFLVMLVVMVVWTVLHV